LLNIEVIRFIWYTDYSKKIKLLTI
jgi:hypothetical protein